MGLKMLIKMLIFVFFFSLNIMVGTGVAGAAAGYHSMMNPVEGELEVTSDFDWRTHPITGNLHYPGQPKMAVLGTDDHHRYSSAWIGNTFR